MQMASVSIGDVAVYERHACVRFRMLGTRSTRTCQPRSMAPATTRLSLYGIPSQSQRLRPRDQRFVDLEVFEQRGAGEDVVSHRLADAMAQVRSSAVGDAERTLRRQCG